MGSFGFRPSLETFGDAQLDYLRGYRDAVNTIADRMLGGGAAVDARVRVRFDESTVTWGLDAILVPQSTLTGAGIKVAVLDTGLDDSHPDFQGRAITKKLFASMSSENDVHGHGTHCIGTACGPLRPNTLPRYGVAFESEIFAGKVLGDDGFGTDRSIIAGMDWALEQGCQIISMPLGTPTQIGDAPSDDYEQIGQVCLDAGTLVVAAAGNESRRPGLISPVGSPANATTIMAVGAVDQDSGLARFSCGGMNAGQDVDMQRRASTSSRPYPAEAMIALTVPVWPDPKFRGWALWTRLLQLTSRLEHPARDVGRGLVQAPARCS